MSDDEYFLVTCEKVGHLQKPCPETAVESGPGWCFAEVEISEPLGHTGTPGRSVFGYGMARRSVSQSARFML